jgi:DNA-binding response OmpR family regulator
MKTNSGKRRILIVEDNQDISDLLVIRLEIAGYATAVASHAAQGLKLVESFKPHGILLDIGLPDGDGFGVLEGLKFVSREPIPVLMLTARQSMDDIKKALALGARDYVTKPFDDQKLLLRVARLLGGITKTTSEKTAYI